MNSPFVPEVISQRSLEAVLGRGRVHCHQRCASTNTEARQLASLDGSCPLVVTEEQTAGRGRLGRDWISEPGMNLLFSLVLRPPVPPGQAARCVLLWAAAMAEVLDLGLKWPNDLVDPQGRKVGGLLAELVNDDGSSVCVVLGVGINVNQRRFDGLPNATSLGVLHQRCLDRTMLLLELVQAIEAVDVTDPGAMERWRARAWMLGRHVRVGGREGIATGVRDDGALLVDGEPVLAGDVELIS